MDKVLNFFKNKWCKRFFSVLSLAFPAFLIYVDWLAFAYSLEPTNPIALFLLYVLVNFIFGGLMFYTRKQIITRFTLCISPLPVFLMMIIDFGNWYLLIPPLVICALAFLASGAGETLKTVLGTIYLLLFVVGALVYLTLLHFNLTPQTFLPQNLNYCDLENRTYTYEYSPNRTYRLVKYIDNGNPERVSATFYVEETENDIELPFANAYRHFDSLKVLVTVHLDELEYYWESDKELYIDGRLKNIPELFIQKRTPEEEEEEETETTTVKKPIIFEDIETSETDVPEETAEPEEEAASE